MHILAIDPGEATGWVWHDTDRNFWKGGTITHNRVEIWNLLNKPIDVIVCETFQLYASHARTLIGSKFYTCEIIGLIKLIVDQWPTISLIEQGASVKKYAGATTKDAIWQSIKHQPTATEHTFDAYQHMKYYLRNKK